MLLTKRTWAFLHWVPRRLTNRSHEHYHDVIMGAIASQITNLTIVFLAVYPDADQRKHQSSASLAFVRGIHRGPVNSPHKWPVSGKFFHMMASSWSPEAVRLDVEIVVSLWSLTVASVAPNIQFHDDGTKWKHFPRYFPFVRHSNGVYICCRTFICERSNLPINGG